MAIPVTCPKCSHAFTPEADRDLEGWKMRKGNEPWNVHHSRDGLYRRARMVVAIVVAEHKGFSKKVDGWRYYICSFEPTLELPYLSTFGTPHWTTNKALAQKLALAEARKAIEALERGELVLVWPACPHGRTRRREATGHVGDHVPLCIDCALEEQKREAEERAETERWRREQEQKRAAREAARPRLVRS